MTTLSAAAEGDGGGRDVEGGAVGAVASPNVGKDIARGT